MNDKDLLHVKQLIESAYLSLKEARDQLEKAVGEKSVFPSHVVEAFKGLLPSVETGNGTIVQGTFDGQMMVSSDGKKYSVPANYASKSKLVEGDQLKLTIKHDGAFVFKQIGPVERKRLKGALFRDEEIEEYRVVAEEKSYKVLTASITYFKGEPGDEVIILVPQSTPSSWAAVEHVLKIFQAHNLTQNLSLPQEQRLLHSTLSNPSASAQEPVEAQDVVPLHTEGKSGLDEIDFVDRI